MHNKIYYLKKQYGTLLETHKEIETELVSYYEDLFKVENRSRGDAIQWVANHIPILVTDQHNASRMHPISLQEVECVVMQMKEGTTPGPDGFTINFFHSCWDLLKRDVLDIVEESHNR